MGVCVGLLVNRVPVVGVCHFPLLGETFWGVTGQGSWLERRVLREPEVDAEGNGESGALDSWSIAVIIGS